MGSTQFALSNEQHIIHRRLLLAKELYLHGEVHSRLPGEFNKMIAVHNLHNAIEVVLRSIYLKYDIIDEKKSDPAFNDILSRVVEQLGKHQMPPLPHVQRIRQLNIARNQIQHHAIAPPDTAVDEYRALAHDFLATTFKTYFQVSLDDISVVDLIANEPLRQLTALAQENLASHNVQGSLLPLTSAFELAMESLIDLLPSSRPEHLPRHQAPYGYEDVARALDNEAAQMAEWVINRVRESERLAVILSAGIHLDEYLRFQAFLSSIPFAITFFGRVQFSYSDKLLPDEEEVRWAFQFVARSILQWQNMGLLNRISSNLDPTSMAILEMRGTPNKKYGADGKLIWPNDPSDPSTPE